MSNPPIDPNGRAMKVACAIAKAIGEKYRETHTTHVVPYNCEHINFIQIDLRPIVKTRKDGVGTTYSEAFYLTPQTPQELNDCAKRIHNDLKVLWSTPG